MADNKLLGTAGLYFGSNEISKAYMGSNLVWEKAGEAGIDYSKEYFYIESINDNTTVSLAAGSYFKYVVLRQGVFPDGLPSFLLYEYWDNIYEAYGGDFTSSSTGTEITTLNEGERLIILGNNEKMGATSIPNIFTFSDSVNVGGNIMSLTHGLDSNNDPVDPSTLPNKQFNNSSSSYQKQLYRLFKNQPVVDAENLVLSATTLGWSQCYREMFYGCTSLIKAPKELPATTLKNASYQDMFRNCSSLTTSPVLPATTLISNCYSGMFRGCSSLNYIKAMFTTTPSTSYTNSWVYLISSTGTFVKNSSAEWDVTGPNGIPSGWTVQTASS